MPGIIENQAWGGQMPEMLLVSIQNTVRTRDLTPTVIDRYESGGGDTFLDFLQNEVMPLVEKEYRTQPYKIFAGHSLGGLFVTYAFAARPEMFNAYIAASPALYFDKSLVVKRAETALAQKKDWNKVMYFAVGDEPLYLDSFNALKSVFDKAKPRGIGYEFRQFKEDNHGSVSLPAFYYGLRKIFAGWAFPPDPSVAVQEAHFKKLSEKFGFEIKVPEDLINTIGYEQLGARKYPEAIAAFKRNTELYPNSANTFDSLAAAYEAAGDKKKARELYEKAYKMAEKNGEPELARSAKANFERLIQK
jgi:tetratricopeptide (TPR) repeat protein